MIESLADLNRHPEVLIGEKIYQTIEALTGHQPKIVPNLYPFYKITDDREDPDLDFRLMIPKTLVRGKFDYYDDLLAKKGPGTMMYCVASADTMQFAGRWQRGLKVNRMVLHSQLRGHGIGFDFYQRLYTTLRELKFDYCLGSNTRSNIGFFLKTGRIRYAGERDDLQTIIYL